MYANKPSEMYPKTLKANTTPSNLMMEKSQMRSVGIQVLVLAVFVIITVGGGAVCGIINAKNFGDESPW